MIFGIGLGKTGTHSLCKAMKILGYRSKHHPTRNDLKHSIDKYDFLNDTVISWQFDFLDVNFPNSKFIMCTREIESWIDSCSRHINLDGSFFTRQSRYYLYGSPSYNEDIYRKGYDKYHQRVLEYFTGRDLLIMDICGGDSWEKLCKWLGKDIPDVPFPWQISPKNKRKEREWI